MPSKILARMAIADPMAMDFTNGLMPPAVFGVGSSVGVVVLLEPVAGTAVGVALVLVDVALGVGLGFVVGVAAMVDMGSGGIMPPTSMVGVG
jgi:hypothetical protein